MHMADALLNPVVGGGMWAVTAGLTAWCAKKVRTGADEGKAPLMGVLGAFIFAAQMINFTIPGTGSSGHLGGGLILAILLGPHAAFLTIASVLTVQALFFGDGGLLALGCNIVNLGLFPCFIAYPFIWKPIAKDASNRGRLVAASIAAAVAGLVLGAFFVVLETVFSGISELPFGAFSAIMIPIHIAIGVVEGLVTAAVVLFVAQARPDILEMASPKAGGALSMKKVLGVFLALALVTGGVVSWFASEHPDGLEWSMGKVSGKEELEAPEKGVHATLAGVQEKTAFLPDYGFAEPSGEAAGEAPAPEPSSPVSAGTSVSGIVGGILTLAIAALIGLLLGLGRKKAPRP